MSNPSTIKYPAVPLANVFLRSGFEVYGDDSEKAVRYADLPGLSAAILYAVITKPGRLSNIELVYLRRKLDFSQMQCAGLLGVKEQTLSLWERDRYSLPIATDALLRRVCIEELGKLFPKRAQFPRTTLFVRLASSISEGKYQCEFDQNRWSVQFQETATNEAVDPVISVVNNLSFSLTPGTLKFEKVRAESTVLGQIYGAPAHAIATPMEKFKQVIHGQVSGRTFAMNPLTRALFVVPSRAA